MEKPRMEQPGRPLQEKEVGNLGRPGTPPRNFIRNCVAVSDGIADTWCVGHGAWRKRR